jgi:hypothetical protein
MSERDRYELKIAGLLHDCGKVTTPVHVVDKATKLQTIFDRIHLIDTRFEVLKRDAEIDALRSQLALRESAGRGRQRRSALAGMPGRDCSSMPTASSCADQHRRRGHAAGRPAARARSSAPAQVAQRRRAVETDFLTADEIENLTIRAGTLTQKERDTINHHIVATIKMLEQLPWPRHLKNVPEYAGGHHERMDGKGYPKGLTREQMSLQARMMGIADIFEALTAARPALQAGMKLSQAMGIMERNFKKGGHIDPDLFDVFVQGKVSTGATRSSSSIRRRSTR